MVLGPLQTLSNGIYDEKTIGIAGINFVQFDWFIVVSYNLLDLLETTPDPWGYSEEVPHGVGSTPDPIQCHF